MPQVISSYDQIQRLVTASTPPARYGIVRNEAGTDWDFFPLARTDLANTFTQSQTVPTVIGSSSSGGTLTLQSTSHATKGKVIFGTSAYDEVNSRLGIGTASPAEIIHADAASNNAALRLSGTYNSVVADVYLGVTGEFGTQFSHNRNPFTGASVNGGTGKMVLSIGGTNSSVGRFSISDGGSHYLNVSQAGLFGVLNTNPQARLHAKTGAATTKGLIVQGAASQSAVILQLQGQSSTSARERVDIDTGFIDNTDATRKYRLVKRVWDTAARETSREWADGSVGRVALSAPSSAPTDAHIAASQVSFYVDESGNNLMCRVSYSDGATYKTGTVCALT